MKKFQSIVLAILLMFSSAMFAQRGRGHGGNASHRPHGAVVVKRSPYHPKKVVVYHPYWHPNHGYNRRWIFFPRYNIYWDNWRNHYVYWNGAVWISQPQAPPVIVNVNLDKEKHKELKEEEDDVDDVYKNNDTHKKEVKAE